MAKDSKRRWGEEDDERLRELHSLEPRLTLRAIAKEIGWSLETVSRHSKRLGLGYDTRATEAAAEARRTDSKRKRSEIVAGLHDDIVELRARIFSETEVYNFGGKDNTFESAIVPEPPHADKLKLIQAINSAAATIERLEKLDADEGVAGAVGMIDEIWQAIRKAAMTPEAMRAAGVEGAELL